jgi:hypothetical protein
VRKLLLAGFVAAAAFIALPSAHAEGLTTQPGAGVAMLIPTYVGPAPTATQVYWHRHYYHHRRYWHR